MKKIYKIFILPFLLFPFSVAISAQTINSSWKDGVVYFKLADDVELPAAANGTINAKQIKLPIIKSVEEKYQVEEIVQSFFSANDDALKRTFRIDFGDAENVYSLLQELQNDPDIEYAEAMPLFYTTEIIPNDYYYNRTLSNGTVSVNASWHLDLINASDAWAISEGNPEIKVAIIDNAVWVDHPDLANKIVAQADMANKDNDANPPNNGSSWSHGTHVAGLVAAETNNAIGIASIGNKISLMAVKCTADNSESPKTLTSALEGIIWAADNGADVINMSFASDKGSQTMQNIINYAYNKGCLLVAAAGNDGKEIDTYPAMLEHVVAVGSCNQNNKKSSFSNFGAWVDVLAPGGNSTASSSFTLLSTVYGKRTNSFGITENYGLMNGTSMACPVVAGLCGLMLSVNPNLTPEKLTQILKSTCKNVDNVNTSYLGKIGVGVIDAYAAVKAASESVSSLTADFRVKNTIVSVKNPVEFIDISTGENPISWQWEFEGGTPNASTEQNPVIIYNEAGTYPVKLTVFDGTNSDTEIKTAFIIVKGGGSSNWIEQNTNFPDLFREISYTSIVNENIVWVLATDGLDDSEIKDFAKTTDGGNTWQAGIIDINDTFIPGGISAVSETKAWVVAYGKSGSGGGIFKTSDGGATWQHQQTAEFDETAGFANIIHMFNENDGFCQGDPINNRFEIFVTTDGGNHWNKIQTAGNPEILEKEAGWTTVVSAFGDCAWFGTNKGRIFKTINKGQTWQAYETGYENVNKLSFSDQNNGVAICSNNSSWELVKTTDGGNTWQKIPVANAYVADISAVPGTPGMLVGIKAVGTNTSNYFSAYSFDNGITWTKIDSGVGYTNVAMHSKDCGWAGSYNIRPTAGGGIYKWGGLHLSIEAPHFTSTPIEEIKTGETYRYEIVCESPAGRTLQIITTEKPDWLSLIDNGNGTAVLEGIAPENSEISKNYNVFLKVTDGHENDYQNFSISVNGATSTSFTEVNENEIYIYPNPSSDFIYIKNGDDKMYEIIDITGRIILSGKENSARINISTLKKGCFFVKIHDKDRINVIKIVKI